MAAPFKVALDYFSYYIGLAKDKKFRSLKNKYGAGNVILTYLALLEMIYGGKGYYLVYNEKTRESIIDTITDEYLNGKYRPASATVAEVIDGLVEYEFFDSYLYERAILTSKRIQQTYYVSTVKRKMVEIDPDKWLLSISEMKVLSLASRILSIFINDENNRVNDGNNGINDGINKQSKVNESKVNRKREGCSSAVLSLPEKNGNSFDISEEMYQGLVKTYANVNVMQSLEAMKAYYDANPQRRLNDYTAKINKWLTQDSVCGSSSVPAHPSSAVSFNLSEYENSSMFDD